ncbi:MAG: tetratricopeptide repeat protein [Rhizobiales bacterium]|nr:tetratricopeptide repeat protein [Hyphomicrobiales bacterium]
MRARFVAVLGAVLLLAACGDDAKKAAEHLAAGQALLDKGQYDKALPELQQAVELDKQSIPAQVALGNAYRGLKRYDDALDTFRAAKKIDRYVVSPHIASALTRVETGQIDMAVDELNHVIELEPQNLRAKILLGRVSMMPHRLPDGTVGVSEAGLERAIMNLEGAVQSEPKNVEAQRELATAYEKAGKTDLAKKTWTTVQALAKGAPTNAKAAQQAEEALTRLK